MPVVANNIQKGMFIFSVHLHLPFIYLLNVCRFTKLRDEVTQS